MQETAFKPPLVRLSNGQFAVLVPLFSDYLCYEVMGKGQAGWKSVYQEGVCGDYHKTQAGAIKCLFQRAELVAKG